MSLRTISKNSVDVFEISSTISIQDAFTNGIQPLKGGGRETKHYDKHLFSWLQETLNCYSPYTILLTKKAQILQFIGMKTYSNECFRTVASDENLLGFCELKQNRSTPYVGARVCNTLVRFLKTILRLMFGAEVLKFN